MKKAKVIEIKIVVFSVSIKSIYLKIEFEIIISYCVSEKVPTTQKKKFRSLSLINIGN